MKKQSTSVFVLMLIFTGVILIKIPYVLKAIAWIFKNADKIIR